MVAAAALAEQGVAHGNLLLDHKKDQASPLTTAVAVAAQLPAAARCDERFAVVASRHRSQGVAPAPDYAPVCLAGAYFSGVPHHLAVAAADGATTAAMAAAAVLEVQVAHYAFLCVQLVISAGVGPEPVTAGVACPVDLGCLAALPVGPAMPSV